MASSSDPGGLEEERRLAYVAITRARELLFLTHTQVRNLFGNTQANPQSRFVAEIPTEHITLSGVGSAGYLGTGWEKRGDRHGIFGSGTPRSSAGDGRVFGSGSGTGSKSDKANTAERDALKKERESTSFTVGDNIDHKTFGRGVVTQVDGDTLHIHFSKSGETKKLLKGYAPIVKIG
jgi:DNA helicase-2/ATP-dependent DNA helicase PcrA